MPAKRAQKPFSEMSANAVPQQKRQKLSTPKGKSTPTDTVDFGDPILATAAPKASKKSEKPPLTTAPSEKFVPLHQVGGPGLYVWLGAAVDTQNESGAVDSECFIRWHQR